MTSERKEILKTWGDLATLPMLGAMMLVILIGGGWMVRDFGQNVLTIIDKYEAENLRLLEVHSREQLHVLQSLDQNTREIDDAIKGLTTAIDKVRLRQEAAAVER